MGQATDYIAFRLEGTSPSGKTKIWQVLNHSGEVSIHLGYIRWRSPWRCYVLRDPRGWTVTAVGVLTGWFFARS